MGERLLAERRSAFVGRQVERQLFQDLLQEEQRSLLFVSGGSGVGKSCLLLELESIAHSRGCQSARLDAATITDRSARAVRQLQRELAEKLAGPAAVGGRSVLFVDSFECLAELESWLLSDVMAGLPARLLLVCASRHRPGVTVRLDAWARLMVHHPLEPLSDDEAQSLLRVWQCPAGLWPECIEAAQGYPLALALAAELALRTGTVSPSTTFFNAWMRSVLDALLPAPLTREQELALEVCCLARFVGLDLLASALKATGHDGSDGVQELFSWLREQRVIDETPDGLQLHQLARIVLLVKFRQNRSDRHARLSRLVRGFFIDDLAAGSTAHAAMSSIYHLERMTLAAQGIRVSEEVSALESATIGDLEAIATIIAETEGEASAQRARRWFETGIGQFEILRERGVDALLHSLTVSSETLLAAGLDQTDPALLLARDFLRTRGIRDERPVCLFRWCIDRRVGQRPEPPMFTLIARRAQIVLAIPELTATFGVYQHPEEWLRIFEVFGLPVEAVGSFELGGTTAAVLAFDWRERPYRSFLANTPAGLPASTPVSSRSGVAPAPGRREQLEQRVLELSLAHSLTLREQEVLGLLCAGASAAEIAKQLDIRPRTVKFHRENTMRKVGVTSWVELLRRVLDSR